MENNVSKWFDAAKRVEPPMSIQEVEAMISQTPKGGFSTLQKSTIMGTLLSAIIGCLLWYLMPQQTQQEYPTLVETTKQASSSGTVTNQAVQAVVHPNHKPKSNVWVQQKNESVQKNESSNTIPEGADIGKIEQLIEPQSNGVLQPETTGSFNGNKLYLSNEELAQLGILTDGETLFYGNITGVILRDTNSKNHFSTPYFSLKINRYGDQRLLSMNLSHDTAVQRSKPFWPAVVMIVKQKNRDTSIAVIEHVLEKSRELDYFNNLQTVLVPVVVNTKSQPSRYSDDLELIFWFKPEDSFFAALPSSLSADVKVVYPPETLQKFKVVNDGFFTQRKGVTYPKGFDSVRVNQLNKKIVELTTDEYKELNIKQTQTGFEYKNKFEQFGKVHDLNVGQKDIATYVMYDGYSLFPKRVTKRDKPFVPVVLTDMGFQRVSYFYMYPDSVTDGRRERLNQERFQLEVDKLVPIKVSNSFILWFPLSPELLEALPERFRGQFDNASTPCK